MRQFERTEILMGYPIKVLAICLSTGIHVGIYGGELPHIGAVSIVDPEGNRTTTQFHAHKDGIISTRWAEALSNQGYRPVVIEAGIHYDNLSRDGIDNVVKLTDTLLAEVLEWLADEKQ